MADPIQSKLSMIAQGFNKALGGGDEEAPQSDTCPHCGKSAAEPVAVKGNTLGAKIGYPGADQNAE